MTENKLQAILMRMRQMRLPEMANQLLMMYETGDYEKLSKDEILEILTEQELMNRKNNTIARYRKSAKLSDKSANLNELDHSSERRINEAVLEHLSDDSYILNHRNIILMGACGTGKSYLANALAANACDHLHTALYTRMFELLGTCASERLITGDSTKSVMKFSKPEVLVIDDFANTSLSETEAIDLFKIMEYRYGNRSTIIASQLEPKEWHKRIPNGILADSILDRIVSNSYKLILSGDSRRPKNNTL